jgi:hypothetical protein
MAPAADPLRTGIGHQSAAKSLGVTIQHTVLARTDEVIE